MKKTNKTLTVTCLLLSVIVLVLIGYISILKGDIQESKLNKNKNTEENTFDLKKAKVLLESFGFNEIINCTSVYKRGYTEDYKMYQAIKQVAEENIIEEECINLYGEENKEITPSGETLYKGETGICIDKAQTIAYSDVNDVHKKLYGEDIPARIINNLDNITYDFIRGRDLFVKTKCNTCDYKCQATQTSEIKEAKQIGNKIIITVYNYESTETSSSDDGTYYFTTDKYSADISCNNKDDCINTIKSDYLEYLDEYEIEFEYKNNQYIFNSLKKITQKNIH